MGIGIMPLSQLAGRAMSMAGAALAAGITLYAGPVLAQSDTPRTDLVTVEYDAVNDEIPEYFSSGLLKLSTGQLLGFAGANIVIHPPSGGSAVLTANPPANVSNMLFYSPVIGPDGAAWVAEVSNIGPASPLNLYGGIDRVDAAFNITRYPIPNNYWPVVPSGSTNVNIDAIYPAGLTVGPDGAIWFIINAGIEGEYGISGAIGRITMQGEVTEFPLPYGMNTNDTNWIVFDAAGNLWLGVQQSQTISGGAGVISGVDEVLQMTMSGQIIGTYVLPENTTFLGGSGAYGTSQGSAVLGSDGNIWMEAVSGTIVLANGATISQRVLTRVTPSGAMTNIVLPASTYPVALAAGLDGNIWGAVDGALARISPTGAITTYPYPTTSTPYLCQPVYGGSSIAVGPDGSINFTLGGQSGRDCYLARFVPGGSSLWPVGVVNATPATTSGGLAPSRILARRRPQRLVAHAAPARTPTPDFDYFSPCGAVAQGLEISPCRLSLDPSSIAMPIPGTQTAGKFSWVYFNVTVNYYQDFTGRFWIDLEQQPDVLDNLCVANNGQSYVFAVTISPRDKLPGGHPLIGGIGPQVATYTVQLPHGVNPQIPPPTEDFSCEMIVQLLVTDTQQVYPQEVLEYPPPVTLRLGFFHDFNINDVH
jgi:streptogramin lyase